MYKPDPQKVLATRQYLENRADYKVTQSQLAKVAGPDLFVLMDERRYFPGNLTIGPVKPVYGHVILKYVLADTDLVAACYQAVGLDPI